MLLNREFSAEELAENKTVPGSIAVMLIVVKGQGSFHHQQIKNN